MHVPAGSEGIEVRLVAHRGVFRLEAEFRTSEGGVIALFGPSGCGKTTLLHLIAGLLRPDSGVVRIGGTRLFDSAAGVDLPAEQRRIGYVFQDARLFPHLSVRGNLDYGARRAPAGAPGAPFQEVVDLLGLPSLLARRPHELSGGERQRVALGRALLARPRVLLLDEPLASLDRPRRAELLPYLERLRDRLAIPIVYVSHEFEEVLRLASHVVLLRAGQVLGQGALASVSRLPALWGLVGADALGAVLEGRIEAVDASSGLAKLAVGGGSLSVPAMDLAPGQQVRVQLLARDLVLSLEPPHRLSVRNALEGSITALAAPDAHTRLVEIDAGGGAQVMAQVTASASRELELAVGRRLWVLVKSVSLRGHVYPAGPAHAAPAAAAQLRADPPVA